MEEPHSSSMKILRSVSRCYESVNSVHNDRELCDASLEGNVKRKIFWHL